MKQINKKIPTLDVYSICLDSYSDEIGEIEYGDGPFFDMTKLVDTKQTNDYYSTYENCEQISDQLFNMSPTDIINLSKKLNLTVNKSTRYIVISLRSVCLNSEWFDLHDTDDYPEQNIYPLFYRVIDLTDNRITDESLYPLSPSDEE